MASEDGSKDEIARDSFIGILLFDVMDAIDRHDDAPTQSGKRDLIRTTFAAVEGVSWIFREHVVEAARAMSELEPAEEVALSETSYQVSDQGRITEQARYRPLLAAVRLPARIAEKLAPTVKIDFSGRDWAHLKEAIKIRNRITHPKSRSDLILSDKDIQRSIGALFWLLNGTSDVMDAANLSYKDYVGQLRDLLEHLNAGDPATLALYEAAAQSLQNDER